MFALFEKNLNSIGVLFVDKNVAFYLTCRKSA